MYHESTERLPGRWEMEKLFLGPSVCVPWPTVYCEICCARGIIKLQEIYTDMMAQALWNTEQSLYGCNWLEKYK